LATIANYYIVCCEAIQSTILAIAWLLVNYPAWVACRGGRLVVHLLVVHLVQSLKSPLDNINVTS